MTGSVTKDASDTDMDWKLFSFRKNRRLTGVHRTKRQHGSAGGAYNRSNV